MMNGAGQAASGGHTGGRLMAPRHSQEPHVVLGACIVLMLVAFAMYALEPPPNGQQPLRFSPGTTPAPEGPGVHGQSRQPAHRLLAPSSLTSSRSHTLNRAVAALHSWSAAQPSSKPAFPPIIHQIFGLFGDGSLSATMQANIQSFKQHNPNHTHILWGAQDLDVMVQRYWPAYWPVYSKLPLPVLKSDLARYMLVSTFGGAYSDIDTRCLKPVDTWADGHQNVGMIIGIEVDAHGMQDWNKIWGHELQFCQWSFAGAPGHPLLSKVIQTSIERLAAEKDVRQITDVKLVCGLTGPYLFTDVVYQYLSQQGYDWRRLQGRNQEEQVGDMYILSITGFSPGVGHMGAGNIFSPRAKVHHLFQGLWKGKPPA